MNRFCDYTNKIVVRFSSPVSIVRCPACEKDRSVPASTAKLYPHTYCKGCAKIVDISGQRYGRLTVIGYDKKVENSWGNRHHWLCECDCGNISSRDGASMRQGANLTCGSCDEAIIETLADDFAGGVPGEVWVDVAGYAGRYMVSNLGRVRSLTRRTTGATGKSQTTAGRLLSVRQDGQTGYPTVYLYSGGKKKNVSVHRIVAEAFCEMRDGATHVNHKNFDKTDNRAENLEWVTPRENTNHAFDAGRLPPPPCPKGEAHHNAKLTRAAVLHIRRGVESVAALADIYGVSKNTVRRAANGDTWSHV